MASITCYWGNVSQPSRAMKAFLDDSGIPHESRHVDMLKSENYTDPEILKYSPAGSLPFLVIDGVVYKETVALMRYLCGKYPDKAMKFYAPADDLETRYEIDKWCDFYTDAFRPAFVREQGAKYQVLGEQRERNEKDEFVIASARGNQKKVMKALEKQLDKAGGKFVTGDQLTLADFVLCSQMQDLRLLCLETGDYPRAMQYEADVLAASEGLNSILKADGTYTTEVLPQAQALMK